MIHFIVDFVLGLSQLLCKFRSQLSNFEDVHFSLVLHSVFNPCSLTVARHVLASNFAKFLRMFTLFTLKQQPFHIRDPSLWPSEVLFSRLPEAARTRMIESMCINILAHLKSWITTIMIVIMVACSRGQCVMPMTMIIKNMATKSTRESNKDRDEG